MAALKDIDFRDIDYAGFLDLLNKSRDPNTNCTPLSSDFFDKFVPSSQHRQLVVSVAYGAICITGLIANIVLLFLLLTGGRKGATFKAPSTILIMNLAIADTLFLLTLPFAISQRLNKGWKFGTVMCKFEEGIKFLNYYGSVFFITAMAIDRYLVVTHPALLNRKRARRFICVASLILWGLALISVLSLLIFAGVDDHGFCTIQFPTPDVVVHNTSSALKALMEEDCMEAYLYYNDYEEYYDTEKATLQSDRSSGDGEQSYLAGSGSVSDYEGYFDVANGFPSDEKFVCKHPNVPGLHAWLIWNFVIGFVLPFIVISCCYIQISRVPLLSMTQLRQHAVSDSANNNVVRYNENGVAGDLREDAIKLISNSEVQTRTTEKNQRARILMNVLVPCLIIAFVVCWLPYHIFHLVQINGVNMGSSSGCHAIRDVTFCLAFFNSALNPILNSFFLFNFKQRLHRSSTWVSGQLKNLSLKRKSNKVSENEANANGGHDNLYDETNAAEMTMMTTADDVDE